MNQALRDVFTPAALAALAPRYGLSPDELKSLGGFESFVYAYARGEQAYILKITHSLARRADYLEGELEWLNALAEHGVPVSRAVASEAGNLIETWPDGEGGSFLAIAYEKAPGAPIADTDLGPELYRTWGRLLGRMHAQARTYEPSREALRRAHWEAISLEGFPVPADHGWFSERADALTARLQALPRGPEAYGLVHGDVHFGNVFWQAGRLTVFDFDDAHYSWFANDIAITLYYAIRRAIRMERDEAAFAGEFLGEFLAGYREEHALDDAWLAEMPDFLRLRRLVLYGALYQAFEPGAMPAAQRQFLADLRRGIEDDSEVVDLDFAAFGAGSPAVS